MQLVNGLHFNNIRGDIYGGLTAAVVALPLAMAMGVASGVGAIERYLRRCPHLLNKHARLLCFYG